MRLSLITGFAGCVMTMLAPAAPDAGRLVVTGRVTNAVTAAPIAGVTVSIASVTPSAGTSTDSRGSYRLEIQRSDVRGPTIRLTARHIGYAQSTLELPITGDTLRGDFALAPSAIVLQELVVTGLARRDQSVERRSVGGANAVRMTPGAAPPADDIRRRSAPWNTESYAAIEDNPFLTPRANPLSTFSIDVDRAAYGNIRRFLTQGNHPPKDAVRIEELINYFPYEYPEPRGAHPLTIYTDIGTAPWSPAHRLLRIGIKGKSIDMRDAPPNNLVFLIDVSGSMQPENKLPLLKQAFRMLVQELRPRDRVAIVVYAGSAGLVLPSTPGDQQRTILDAIDRLEAGGSTAGGAGIKLAYAIARQQHSEREGPSRVILATDGDFNVGASSDAEMVRLIEREREGGIFLTVLGFGYGNLKDSKLEQLANKGNGNYAYIDSPLEARKVLVTEMGGTLVTIAKDVKLQVEFNPARVAAYRLIGYENRLLAAEDFDDDTKDAGELGAGHTVTALYEIVPVGARTTAKIREPGQLRYQTATSQSGAAETDELLTVKLRYKEPRGGKSRLLEQRVLDRATEPTVDFLFVTAVAELGLLLRDSEHKGRASYEDVLARAERGLGEDPHGYRREFLSLVRRAAEINQPGAESRVRVEDQ